MMDPVRVLVTGAAGQIAYSLFYSLASGDVFGRNQPIELVLLDLEAFLGVLRGVVMELQDCAFPLLKEVMMTTDVSAAFKDVDVAVLVGAMPRREGMERKDLLAANVGIFKHQGAALDRFAKKTVKVVVVGNPANTNAYICRKYAPSIPKENFTCLTRLDQNRATAQIGSRLGTSPQSVNYVFIWGNHSSTQFPDVSHATIVHHGQVIPVSEAVGDHRWIENDFIKTVQNRGAAVIGARKLSSALSAAKAIADHLHDWWFGTPPGVFVSMGVVSDGSYGVDAGLVFSFPVEIRHDRTYSIVRDLSMDAAAQARLKTTLAELAEERDMALEACGEPKLNAKI